MSKTRIGKARLDAMVEEAVVDANGESERAAGLFTMIENNLKLPFEATILGMPVVVEKIDLNKRDEIVAVCRRGKHRQIVPVLDLPLPEPPPRGAEWIEAYRHYLR